MPADLLIRLMKLVSSRIAVIINFMVMHGRGGWDIIGSVLGKLGPGQSGPGVQLSASKKGQSGPWVGGKGG